MLLFAFSKEMQTAFPFSFQLQRYVHVSWSWTDRSHKSSLDPTKTHSPITQGCEKKLWRALDFHSAPVQPAGPLPSALHDVQCTGGSGVSWFLFYMTGNTHFSMAQWRHNSTELYLLHWIPEQIRELFTCYKEKQFSWVKHSLPLSKLEHGMEITLFTSSMELRWCFSQYWRHKTTLPLLSLLYD